MTRCEPKNIHKMDMKLSQSQLLIFMIPGILLSYTHSYRCSGDVCENYAKICSSVNQMRRHSNRKAQQQTTNKFYTLGEKKYSGIAEMMSINTNLMEFALFQHIFDVVVVLTYEQRGYAEFSRQGAVTQKKESTAQLL